MGFGDTLSLRLTKLRGKLSTNTAKIMPRLRFRGFVPRAQDSGSIKIAAVHPNLCDGQTTCGKLLLQ
jgi:hypothetical protein